MKDDDQVKALKQETVGLLVAIAPRGWKRIFCDYEWHEGESSFVGSEVTIAVVRRLFGGIDCVPLNLMDDGRVITNFQQIALAAMKTNQSKHCTVDLIIRSNDDHEWHVDFSPPPRLTAKLAGDLEATYRNPELKKPYRKFAAQDEWLAKIR